MTTRSTEGFKFGMILGVPHFNWGPSYVDAAQSVIDAQFEAEWQWLGPDGNIQLYVGPLKWQDGTPLLAAGEPATDFQIWYSQQLLEGIVGASADPA